MSEKYKVHTSKLLFDKLACNNVDFERDILPRQIRNILHSLVDEILKNGDISQHFAIVQNHTKMQVEISATSVVHEYLARIEELKENIGVEKYQRDVYTQKFFKERDEKDKAVKRLANALKVLSENNLMEDYIKEGGLE